MFSSTEAEALKERRDASEETDASDAIVLRLLDKRLNEKTARSATSCDWTNNDGAYLGQVESVDVQRGAAEELAVFGFDHGECVNIPGDLWVRAREKCAVVGVAVNEKMDGFGIAQLGLARLQWHGALVRRCVACCDLGVRVHF